MERVAWKGGKHGRNQQTVPVQQQSYLELPQEFNVLLAVGLREELALEHV